jgi:hypothetical protein
VFLLALLALAVAALPAVAGTMTLTPSVVARFDPVTFDPLPLLSPPGGTILDGPGVYQVDLSFTSTTGEGERGWANTSFNIELLGGLTDPGWGGWIGDTSLVDINGAPPPGANTLKYATNLDAGVVGDLQGILISIAGGVMNVTLDPRATLGTPTPDFLGSVFLQTNGEYGRMKVNNVSFSMADTAGQFLAVQSADGSVIHFEIPEPSTFALFGLALVGLVGLRRRG